MIHRLSDPTTTSSFLLLGPRGTGKSTWLKQRFQPDDSVLWLDLLDPEDQDRFSRRPNELAEEIEAKRGRLKWVVIDEIQKVSRLLDVVHSQIEKGSCLFAMSGSSARRLKRDASNLLGGRAFVHHLFPLTHRELADAFDLDSSLAFGSLPKLLHFSSEEDKKAFLRAYALTYLSEEIWAEHVIRKLDPFRRFLEVAAQANGEILNYTNVARDVGADVKTVQSYFQILEDTLVGILLDPFHLSIRKRQLKSPKFYLFDPGVKRALDRTLNVPLQSGTYAYGKAFEHLIVIEAHRLNAYRNRDYRFSYLRTKDGAEIDLVVERPGNSTALVEIKSADHVDERDTRMLEAFLSDMPDVEGFCLSRDPREKRIGRVLALPWMRGLEEMGL